MVRNRGFVRLVLQGTSAEIFRFGVRRVTFVMTRTRNGLTLLNRFSNIASRIPRSLPWAHPINGSLVQW